MSNNFCSTCNRLRITADGILKTCLFGSDDTGLNLLHHIRNVTSDVELACLISDTIKNKKKMLGGSNSPQELSNKVNRPMILIGG